MTITNLPAMGCLIASLTLAGTPALAAPTDDASADSDAQQADEMRARAETAFEEGDFEEAFRQFEAAHATSPHPSDLFNLGRISEEKGELEVALGYYEQFVRMEVYVSIRKASTISFEFERRGSSWTLELNVTE